MSENTPELRLQSEAEIRQIWNMMPEDIYSTENHYYENDGRPVASLASQWAMQGIQYELTAPIATESRSTADLARMGLRGVTLIIPKKTPTAEK